MKLAGDWQGAPGYWLDQNRRFVATKGGWKIICNRLRKLAENHCENCGHSCHGDAHHRYGRGGGKRDDRIWRDGRRNLLLLCRLCHDTAVIERRYDSPTAVPH